MKDKNFLWNRFCVVIVDGVNCYYQRIHGKYELELSRVEGLKRAYKEKKRNVNGCSGYWLTLVKHKTKPCRHRKCSEFQFNVTRKYNTPYASPNIHIPNKSSYKMHCNVELHIFLLKTLPKHWFWRSQKYLKLIRNFQMLFI